MVNAFFNNLNTVDIHFIIKKLCPFYKIMKEFIFKVNSFEISKVASSSVSLMLNLTWGIDIFFENLTAETGLNLK